MIGRKKKTDAALAGLVAIVNCGSGPDEYARLAQEMPEFWPIEVLDANGRSLAWHHDCHPLFLAFRDALQRIWVHQRKAKRDGVPDLLLGLAAPLHPAESFPDVAPAMDRVLDKHPGARLQARAGLRVDWSTAGLLYAPGTEFGAAVWELFKRPWRSRVCPHCERFYLATKKAQRYCSAECQHEARLVQFRRYWHEKGKQRAAEKGQ